MVRDPKFLGTITYQKKDMTGIALYTDRKSEPSTEDLLDELEKDEIRGTRKDLLLAKLKERMGITVKGAPSTQPSPKRYLVDPETGRIEINEEEGELTYKDALVVSASIKGKGGHYDEAISLLNAVKAFGQDNKEKLAEKPKEYFVEPDTGIIVHDPENGEYTLAEARTISQSMQKVARQEQLPLGSYVDEEGNVTELKVGQPIVIKKVVREPGKTYFMNAEGELQEQETGKPIVIKMQASPAPNMQFTPFPAMSRDGNPITDKDGRQVYVDIEPQMKWLNFQGEQRRADERHDSALGLFQTIRENIPDGIQAILQTVTELKGTAAKAPPKKAAGPPLTFECEDCHSQFSPPAQWTGEQPLKCPACGREYSKEELLA